MTGNRSTETPMDDRLYRILQESYKMEKALEKVAQTTRTIIETKILGLMLGLVKMDQAILAAQALEQKKRRWHLYRAAREEYYQEIDDHETLATFVPFSRTKRQIPGATSPQKMG